MILNVKRAMSDIFWERESALDLLLGYFESSQKNLSFSKSSLEQHDFVRPLQYWELFESWTSVGLMLKNDNAGQSFELLSWSKGLPWTLRCKVRSVANRRIKDLPEAEKLVIS